MDRSEVRVFIVEDDVTMAASLAELIKRLKFQAVVCHNPTDALNQFRLQACHLFIIDCLLPRTPGVELAKQLRAQGATEIPMILMSGVHRDKAFIKDAIHQTKAEHFFTKPFDVKEFQGAIVDALSSLLDEEISVLEKFMVTSFTPGERVKALNAMGNIEALEIPWGVCQIMAGSLTGTVKLKDEAGEAQISFHQGKIVQIQMKNDSSFFGALLIEKGYLTEEQLQSALKSDSKKKVGERLVEMNLLSPHLIDVINSEQSGIRLSKLIDSQKIYSMTFTENDVANSQAYIDTERLAPFIIAWLNSKMTLPWLKQKYLKWINSAPHSVNRDAMFTRLWTMPPLHTAGALTKEFETGQTLAQVLSSNKYREIDVYQVFHLLILIEHIKLRHETKPVDEAAQIARLENIWQNMQTQDYFAIFGLNKKSKASDFKRMYYDLAKIFHPDKVPSTATPKLKELAQKVFGQFTKAYEVLADDAKRDTYIKEIDMGRAEKILEAEAIYEQGKIYLKSGQGQKARIKFEQALGLNPPTSELLIHLAWARIISIDDNQQTKESLKEIEETLDRIPPEDRHNATYYFVKSLFQKMTGDLAAAKKNLQHALFMNPKFKEAERLLRVVEAKINSNKPSGILHADLKEVVGSFFRKK